MAKKIDPKKIAKRVRAGQARSKARSAGVHFSHGEDGRGYDPPKNVPWRDAQGRSTRGGRG